MLRTTEQVGAQYLPARSFLCDGKLWHPDNHQETRLRLPKRINSMWDLELLNSSSLAPAPEQLNSAGNANLDPAAGHLEYYFRQRDRSKTFVIGDSGGFQIGKGVIKADWTNMDLRAVKARKLVHDWQQSWCDWGATLDVPTWIVNHPRAMKNSNISNVAQANAVTLRNLDYYLENSTGTCRWLNVLQGNTFAEADDFYSMVKHYAQPRSDRDHTRGWCLGAVQSYDPEAILLRIAALVEDGLIATTQRLHFLGQGKIEQILLFDALADALRQHLNPEIQVSCDSSTPLLRGSKGEYYTGWSTRGGRWTLNILPAPWGPQHCGSTTAAASLLPKNAMISPVLQLLDCGDIAYKPESKTSYDGMSYILLQTHNLWVMQQCIAEARQLWRSGERPKSLDTDPPLDQLLADIFTAGSGAAMRRKIQQYSTQFRSISKYQANSHTMFGEFFSV